MSQSAPDHGSNALVDSGLSMNEFNAESANSYPNGPMNQRYKAALNSQSPMTQHQMMPDRPGVSRVQSLPSEGPSMDSYKTRNASTVPSSHHPTTPVMVQNGPSRNAAGHNLNSSMHPPIDTASYSNPEMPLSRQSLETSNKDMNQQRHQQQQVKLEDQGDQKLPHNQGRTSSVNGQGQPHGSTSQGNTPIGQAGSSAAGNTRMGFPMHSVANQQEISAKIFKRNLGNAGVMRILDLIDLISSEPHSSLSKVEFWVRLCETYASPSASIRISIAIGEHQPKSEVKPESGSNSPMDYAHQYRLNASTAPSFFVAAGRTSEVTDYQISLSGVKFQVLNNGSVFLASNFSNTFTYIDGSVGKGFGECRILLNRDFRIGSIDFKITRYESSMPVSAIQKMWSSLEAKNEETNFMKKVLAECKSEQATRGAGLNGDALRLLRMSDVMCQLSPLMNFGMANNINSPILALQKYVAMGGGQSGQNSTSGANNGQNGANSSPSPKSSTSEDTSKATKKRRVSNPINSPMSSGPIASEQKR